MEIYRRLRGSPSPGIIHVEISLLPLPAFQLKLLSFYAKKIPVRPSKKQSERNNKDNVCTEWTRKGCVGKHH